MGNCSAQGKTKTYGSEGVSRKSADALVNDSNITIHQGSILGLCYATENRLLTCSDDKNIAIVGLDNILDDNYVPKFLIGHSKAVNRVISSNSWAWSASRDLSLKFVSSAIHTCVLAPLLLHFIATVEYRHHRLPTDNSRCARAQHYCISSPQFGPHNSLFGQQRLLSERLGRGDWSLQMEVLCEEEHRHCFGVQ